MSYRTFLRSCTDWESFASAEKIEQEQNLTSAKARQRCEEFNKARTRKEIEAGTKMEFEEEA